MRVPGAGRRNTGAGRVSPVLGSAGRVEEWWTATARATQGGSGGGEGTLLCLRGDQRPGQLGRLLRLPGHGEPLEGTAGQTLPVIVETSEFRSELTVTNFSEEPRTLGFPVCGPRGSSPMTRRPASTMALEAGEQEIIPTWWMSFAVRGWQGWARPGASTGPLFVEAEDGDMSGIVIGARTGSEGEVGQYGVFYNAVPEGGAFGRWPGWTGCSRRGEPEQLGTGEHRGIDDSESVFSLEIYDGETGSLVTTVTTKSIPPGAGTRSTASWATTLGELRRATSGSGRSRATTPSWPTGSSTTVERRESAAATEPTCRPGSKHRRKPATPGTGIFRPGPDGRGFLSRTILD